MAGGQLKEVRTRIKSVISTQQITKAMKMVSAAKLRRAQESIQQMRPYSLKLSAILQNIVASQEGEMEIELAKEREVNKVLIILVTSDRGLCGAFNSSLIKLARTQIEEKYQTQAQAGNVKMLCIGTKGFAFYKKLSYEVISDYVELFSDLSFDGAAKAANYVMDAFQKEEFDKVDLIYSQFKNAATQIFTAENYLPIAKPEDNGSVNPLKADFIFEPSKKEITEHLIPKILKTQLYKALLDSNASEHGARMTAMDKATENANDLLRDLRIDYNRARQAAITTEISEIVGGAAALEQS